MSKTQLSQIEEELTNFYEYCKDLGLKQDEIRQICSSLLPTRGRNKFLVKIIVALIVLIGVLYVLSQFEYFAWHFSAIARILMIKLLPFYNWEKLKYSKCLIDGFDTGITIQPNFDCYYCETIDSVAFSDKNEPEFLKLNYLDLDIPVIFKEEFGTKTGVFNSFSDYISKIIEDEVFHETSSCKLATNLPITSRKSIAEILITSEEYNKFFLHFQNCDFSSVKALRRVFPRPPHYFDEVAPVQYSWLVFSKNYGGGKFKKIELRDKLTSFKQIIGRNYVRLYPTKNCIEECSFLETHLDAGEVLYFTALWDLEYRASGDEENFAVIFETHY